MLAKEFWELKVHTSSNSQEWMDSQQMDKLIMGVSPAPHSFRKEANKNIEKLTSTVSTNFPSGITERFILAIHLRVARAASSFPQDTLYRADSGINCKIQMS